MKKIMERNEEKGNGLANNWPKSSFEVLIPLSIFFILKFKFQSQF